MIDQKASLSQVSGPAILERPRYSPNDATNEAINDLLDLGLVPLAVAPAQDPFKYPLKKNGSIVYEADGVTPKPMFNGKNPSYIDAQGEPRSITHSHYRDSLPKPDEVSEWFQNPAVGVGTLANGNVNFLDIDAKRFSTTDAMESALAPIVDAAPWVERTQGGGYRIAVKPKTAPDYQNIGIGDIPHCGEFMNGGGFVVLAPSIGPSGKPYERLKFGEPLAVERIEDLGFYPSRKASQDNAAPIAQIDPADYNHLQKLIQQASGYTEAEFENGPVANAKRKMSEWEPTPTAPINPVGNPVALSKLVSKKLQPCLSGDLGEDRSDGITRLARELYGWENIARAEGVTLTESAESILNDVAAKAGLSDRLKRILAAVNPDHCEPGLSHAKGHDAAVDRLLGLAGVRIEKQGNGDILIQDEDTPGRIAYRYLYEGQGYINLADDLYKWVGTHYEPQKKAAELNRISTLLNRCVKETVHKEWVERKRPYATSAAAVDAYKWALARAKHVPLDDINPGGLNLKNGVLVPDYSTAIPRFSLIPHSPDRVYTYCGEVAYNPEADTTEAERLLSAIPQRFRQTVLRVKSAAIDLFSVRKKVGRDVRAMFWAGEGSNGKDAIRAAAAAIFGHQGITSVSVKAFSIYDEGKQPWKLAPLINSRINWPSENSAKESINRIESLKAVVAGTGEIDYERKNKDAEQFTPKCVCIFNTNDTQINLDHRSEAMASRYVIVPFPYRFTKNPTGPNDIKADPRFVYDPQWVTENVCPGLLNLMIAEFQNIWKEGFDYSVFDEVMEQNLENSSHLYQFKSEMNLIEDSTAITPIGEIWQALRNWYETEEILKIDSNSRDIWVDDTRPGDKWIRTKEQLGQRLRKMFPTAESYRDKKGRGIKGIRFATDCEMAIRRVSTLAEWIVVHDSFTDKDIQDAWLHIPLEHRQKIEALAASQPQPQPTQSTPIEVSEVVTVPDSPNPWRVTSIDADSATIKNTETGDELTRPLAGLRRWGEQP